MQKRILLLLLLNSFVLCAMEKESSRFFSPLCSFLPKRFTHSSVSLSPMQKLQADKDAFEKWLWRTDWFSGGSRTTMTGGLPYSSYYIHLKPVKFLKYCYMQHLHEGAPRACNIHDLYTFSVQGRHEIGRKLLSNCKKARKNGCSALGAAILARNVSAEYKRNFIYSLLQYGFTLTDKDRGLLKLVLYQAVPVEVTSLLHDMQQGDFAVLPQDVRRSIVYHIACLLKGKEWISLLL